MLIVFASIVVSGFIFFIIEHSREAISRSKKLQALYLAESGIQEALYHYAANSQIPLGDLSGVTLASGKTFTVNPYTNEEGSQQCGFLMVNASAVTISSATGSEGTCQDYCSNCNATYACEDDGVETDLSRMYLKTAVDQDIEINEIRVSYYKYDPTTLLDSITFKGDGTSWPSNTLEDAAWLPSDECPTSEDYEGDSDVPVECSNDWCTVTINKTNNPQLFNPPRSVIRANRDDDHYWIDLHFLNCVDPIHALTDSNPDNKFRVEIEFVCEDDDSVAKQWVFPGSNYLSDAPEREGSFSFCATGTDSSGEIGAEAIVCTHYRPDESQPQEGYFFKYLYYLSSIYD
jgi:hypothetical protein